MSLIDETPPEGDDLELEEGSDEWYEHRARQNGWKPREEHRGERPWVDAKTFVTRGDTIIPILQSNMRKMEKANDRLTRQNQALEERIAGQQKAIDAAVALAKRADDNGYQRALAEMKAKRREAIDGGDATKAEEISDQIDAMVTERATVPAPAEPARPAAAPANGSNPDIDAFIAANPWFNTDIQLRDSMVDHHKMVIRKFPSLTLAEQLVEAKKRLVADFPDKFQRPAPPTPDPDPPSSLEEHPELEADDPPAPRAPSRAPSVLTPRGAPPARPGRSPFDAIEDPKERAEARAGLARINQGLDEDMTPEEYIAIYFGPKEFDTLGMLKKRQKK